MDKRSPRGRSATRPVLAVLGAGALVAGVCTPATATGGHDGAPVVTREVTHVTARIGDEQHGFLVFVNKSRADLCTPERIAFENALEAWFDSGYVGDPPQEPADSQQGVGEVVLTTRETSRTTTNTLSGENLPVEVWRVDDEEGGIDCTATDGPGAELFAAGEMDWSNLWVATGDRALGDLRLSGTVTGAHGARYRYSVRYVSRSSGGDFTVTPMIRLVRIR